MLFFAPLGFLLAFVGGLSAAIVGFVAAAALASLPDQDLRVPFIKHRGITHTVWFALVTGLVLGAFGALIGAQQGLILGLALGVLGFLTGCLTIISHIAADAITPMGVRPLAPMSSKKIVKPIARAKNPIANYALLGIGYAVAIAATGAGVMVRSVVGGLV